MHHRHDRAGSAFLRALAALACTLAICASAAPADRGGTEAALSGSVPEPGGSPLILRRVRLKGNLAKPGKANGKAILRGFMNVNNPYASFPNDILTGGFTALVDGAGMSAALTWTAAECKAQQGRPGNLMIRCVSADKQRKAIFRPGSGVLAPNVYKFRLGGKRLDFAPPLTTDPIQLIIVTSNHNPVDTIGEAGTCRVKGGKSHVAVCKESGIFTVP